MGSEVSFRTKSGKDPAEAVMKIRKALVVTEGDLLYAGQRQRTRILDRTGRGVDVNGQAFAPYSQKGPFYYYPNGRTGNSRFSEKQNKAAASRLFRKLTGKGAGGHRAFSAGGKGSKVPSKHGEAWVTRSGRGLGFSSYAAFKRWLGRALVDLRGARSPHMLQAIMVKTGNRQFGLFGNQAVGPAEMPNRADELVLGIYGDAAKRASGHNTGGNKRSHLPKRKFFGASADDKKQMVRDVYQRMKARLGVR